MENIEKALQALTEAVESNEALESIRITITVKKPKPSKATKGSE